MIPTFDEKIFRDRLSLRKASKGRSNATLCSILTDYYNEIVQRRYSSRKKNVNLCFPFVEKYDELIYSTKKVTDLVPLEETASPYQKKGRSFELRYNV